MVSHGSKEKPFKPVVDARSFEQQFLRVAGILEKMWYMYRASTIMTSITNIDRSSPGTMTYQEGSMQSRRYLHQGTPRLQFPVDPNIHHSEWRSLLSFLSCKGSVGQFDKILQWWLDDIAQSIEEVDMALKSPELRIVRLFPDGTANDNTDYVHSFWRITLKSGASFALDLTGAQYGWYEPAVTWSECVQNRCQEPTFVNQQGTAHAFFRAFDSCARARVDKEFRSQHSALKDWQRDLMNGFEKGLMKYVEENGLLASNILTLPEEDFHAAETDYLREVDVLIRRAALDADKIWYEKMANIRRIDL